MTELNPRMFDVSMENAYKPHQKTAILPGVNLPYVNKILTDNNYKLPKNLQKRDDLIVLNQDDSMDIEEQNVVEDYDSDDDRYSVSNKKLI